MEEELKALRLKEKILEIELKSVRDQITVYTTMILTDNSVQETERLKTESIPVQTAPGKETPNPFIPVALEKSKPEALQPRRDLHSKKANIRLTPGSTFSEVVHLRKMEQEGSSSSNSSDANGSEAKSSNPLTPDTLVKSGETSLRPSYAEKAKMPAKDDSRYYVIFEGPNAGIYEDWGIVSKLVNETSFAYKKYRLLTQAYQAAERYQANFGGKKIIFKAQILVPKIQVQNSPRRQVVFTKKEETLKESTPDIFEGVDFSTFRTLWSKARALSIEDYDAEKIYTDDKKSRSLFVICSDADPSFTYQAFCAGLVKTIYPSRDLKELKFFPKGFKKAIGKFVQKIAKNVNIYIQITSSIPDWIEDKVLPPYHYVELGLAAQREVQPSKIMNEEDDFVSMGIYAYRVEKMIAMITKTQKLNNESKTKVNFFHSQCMITSATGKTLIQEDQHALQAFEEKILKNKIKVGPTTKKMLCERLQKIDNDHQCALCKNINNAKADSDKTRKAEDALSTTNSEGSFTIML